MNLSAKLAPSGVYLLPSNDDLHVFFGVIFLRQGLYKNGIFKFRVNLRKSQSLYLAKVLTTLDSSRVSGQRRRALGYLFLTCIPPLRGAGKSAVGSHPTLP